MKTLVIGIGNPGRTDDGLGVALAEAAESWELPGVRVAADYQLNIEHAAEVAESDLVIFIDASVAAPPPFSFYRLEPEAKNDFTTHAMQPETVLATCRQVYGRVPPSYVLALHGEDFELGEGISASAGEHLEKAREFLCRLLQPGDLKSRCAAAAIPRSERSF